MRREGNLLDCPLLLVCRWTRFSIRIPQGVTSPRYLRLLAEKLADSKKLLYKYLIYEKRELRYNSLFFYFLAVGSLFFRDPHGTSCTGAACD